MCDTRNVISKDNVLYFYITTFPSICAVPNMAVVCSCVMSCFPGMLLGYFLDDFEVVSLTPVIIGITSAFTFHINVVILFNIIIIIIIIIIVVVDHH